MKETKQEMQQNLVTEWKDEQLMVQMEQQPYWVNLTLFYRKLDELNLSVAKLADLIGIAASSLYKKLEMKSQFKLNEIRMLQEAMHLSREESYWIFIAGYVEQTA